jgi:hypothetical protein
LLAFIRDGTIVQELDALQSELQTLSRANIGQKQQQMLKQLEQQQEQQLADCQQAQHERTTRFTLEQEQERRAHEETRSTKLKNLQEGQQEGQHAIEQQVMIYSYRLDTIATHREFDLAKLIAQCFA